MNPSRDLCNRASAKYRKLAQGTKPDYDRVMDAILEKNATKPVRNMTRAAVLAIHAKYGDTPRKAVAIFRLSAC
ncbi:hypothetical protein SAMN04489859_102567 [Paracoccus alcaliphilus]|uniref:Uncharacterized protein n=1 Tax=Paracoccus alcaliphilus TaxID=34002 RepID=A0A1H8KX25_9RHOB|nr:hypothetical protein SAMN04489859_102567 [Paracoccus alcaliphilus]